MNPTAADPADTASEVLRNAPPQQQEMPLAFVRGQPMLQIPQDLYIPRTLWKSFSMRLRAPLICCSI
jgi:hypothetical protein